MQGDSFSSIMQSIKIWILDLLNIPTLKPFSNFCDQILQILVLVKKFFVEIQTSVF